MLLCLGELPQYSCVASDRDRRIGGDVSLIFAEVLFHGGRALSDNLIAVLPYALVVVLTALPSFVLLGKLGLSKWWCLMSLLPIGAIVILWVASLRLRKA